MHMPCYTITLTSCHHSRHRHSATGHNYLASLTTFAKPKAWVWAAAVDHFSVEIGVQLALKGLQLRCVIHCRHHVHKRHAPCTVVWQIGSCLLHKTMCRQKQSVQSQQLQMICLLCWSSLCGYGRMSGLGASMLSIAVRMQRWPRG